MFCFLQNFLSEFVCVSIPFHECQSVTNIDIFFDHYRNISREAQIIKLILIQVSSSSPYLFYVRSSVTWSVVLLLLNSLISLIVMVL
jgi:hypothetical protein